MRKIVDERLARETNAMTARMYWLMLALQLSVLIVKLVLGAGLMQCILDLLVLAVGLGGMAILRTAKGLWGAKDEVLREIDDACLTKLFMAMFWLLVFGEFLLAFSDGRNLWWYAPYVLVWGLPAVVITVKSLRQGLLLWGGRQQEKAGKARLLKGTVLGAVFFGVVIGGPSCFKDGSFQPSGLVQVLMMGAVWGTLFYVMFSAMMKRGEKAADQAVAEAETRMDDAGEDAADEE
ncbi:MAG: hypothetical protein IJZ74_10960 [Clostridia bacterium]|nr:hypothetical protein [Clostridia bacterium]